MSKQQIETLKDCWEACMDLETAFGCATGLDEVSAEAETLWSRWESDLFEVGAN